MPCHRWLDTEEKNGVQSLGTDIAEQTGDCLCFARQEVNALAEVVFLEFCVPEGDARDNDAKAGSSVDGQTRDASDSKLLY